MNHQVVIEAINPAMSAIFAGGLLALWHHQRGQAFIAIIAATYAAKTLGFVVHFLSIQQQVLPLRLVSNSLWVLAACLLSAAIAVRFDLPRRYKTHAAISVATMAAVAWHIFVRDDIAIRIVVINAGVVAIFLQTAIDFTRRPGRNLVEQFMLSQLVLTTLGFLLRPLSLLKGDAAKGIDSAYWMLFAASDIVLSTLLGLAIFAVIAVDVVDKLRSDSILDPLSGLLNRRGFEQKAGDVMKAIGPSGPPVAVVLGDLDHFKSVNDRFGHAVGDRVIQDFGLLLSEGAPPDALVARLGGEEFAVLLPRSDETVARLFAESTRAVLAARPSAELPDGTRPTASFGIAVAPGPEHLDALVERADQALYRAKRTGRDRVSSEAPGPFVATMPQAAAGAGRVWLH